jgi:diguanylate cyclase (GGDEF)-like protein/PAS domain S-box-containing protein
MNSSSHFSTSVPTPDQATALQTALSHIDQGVMVIDAEQHIAVFNPQLCRLLDLSPELLATRPTIQDITQKQSERGDFGPQDSWLESSLQSYIQRVAQGENDDAPAHYQRVTRAGRTLDIRSDTLPDGAIVRVFTDITNLVLEHAAHRKLDQLTTELQAIAKIGGWEIDLVSRRITWTEGTYRIFEATPDTFSPTWDSIRCLFTEASWNTIVDSYTEPANKSSQHELEIEMRTLTGRPIWVLSMGTTTWVDQNPVLRTAIVQDITERRIAQANLLDSEARWKLALESTGDGLWDLNLLTGDEYLSPSLLRMYGYDDKERHFQIDELDKRTHPYDLGSMLHARQQHIDWLTPHYRNEHRVQCRDGSWKWILSRGMVISRDTNGRALRMIGTHTDISERKAAEALVWQQAHFDALTGLPNRRMLRERLDQELKKCRRDDHQLAVLFLDLDRFKEVNDALGHDQGDVLLVEAARRISVCLREVDTVARMGGDEFTVLVTELQHASDLEGILDKLLQTLGKAFTLGSEQVFISVSIGVTIYPTDATEIEDLLKNADQALYAAKGAGRNRYNYFTLALQHAAQWRAQLTHDLREALAEQQFRVVFQPIVELSSGAIHKAEALVRWQHPARGLISPAEFIPVAESCGLIVPLGGWVFEQAANQVQAWRTRLHPQFQISVNKSPVQFENPSADTPSWINQLKALGLGGDSIVVEITEGLLLSNSDAVVAQLLQLSQDGMGVSLDDFGTGYSSLAYLQKFDIDYLKIDQSFVRQLAPDSTDLALCRAIIVMAHALGIKVIAEGVETRVQCDLLAHAGCDYAQGYFYARPLPAAEFEVFFAQNLAQSQLPGQTL